LKILALETSTPRQSLATILDGVVHEHLNEERELAPHSANLFSNIQALLERSRWSLTDIDGIAFSGGPGSLTGLRIGAMAAIGMGISLQKPLAKISSLKALALKAQDLSTEKMVGVIVNAHMNEVHFALYRLPPSGEIITELDHRVMPPQEVPALLPPRSTLIGDGIGEVERLFQLAEKEIVIEKGIRVPDARQIGVLAYGEFIQNRGLIPSKENIYALEPSYGSAWKSAERREHSAKSTA
jgi:tRNA threonylcarbamoyl adenosine modification protein YeaZ